MLRARPQSHWPIITRTGALRLPGMIVPMRPDGLTNGGAVLAYVEQVLVTDAADR